MVSGLLSVAGLVRRRVVVGGAARREVLARDLPPEQPGEAHRGGLGPGLPLLHHAEGHNPLWRVGINVAAFTGRCQPRALPWTTGTSYRRGRRYIFCRRAGTT